ncbi:MAG TPA: family 20 glycosylhydrolase [Candidatus Limnocylindria bacterium]|nr:family 20 glycosylhydrolase [Candidatus Limnocylindria bacterium]
MPTPDLAPFPPPQRLVLGGGTTASLGQRRIHLALEEPDRLRVATGWLMKALVGAEQGAWSVDRGTGHRDGGISVRLDGGVEHPEGFRLRIGHGVELTASTHAGAAHGLRVLADLVATTSGSLPELLVEDEPDLEVRGVMLDVSRNRVPRLDQLLRLVDQLARWGINQLQLYFEAAFAYPDHPEPWSHRSPFTGDEIRELDGYCRDRFIELVPNQNSFGHLERWLRLDRYRHLAERPERPFSLCPTDPASLEFVGGLYDELLRHFRSRQLNVGADETADIGQGRSREEVARRGVGRVYLDFLRGLHAAAARRDHTIQFWGDIIERRPELVPEIPTDATALLWGYEADHPFDRFAAPFADAGLPFMLCPGTSSWDSLVGRSANAIANLANAATAARGHGARGMLITDWGDSGHWQPPSVSRLPLAYGAAVAWRTDAAASAGLLEAAKGASFGDVSPSMGDLAYRFGEVHSLLGGRAFNASLPFLFLKGRADGLVALLAGEEVSASDLNLLIGSDAADALRAVDRRGLDAAEEATEALEAELRGHDLPGPEGDAILSEYAWLAATLRHALGRARWIVGRAGGDEDTALRASLAAQGPELEAGFAELWHRRSRPGGFAESAGALHAVFADYE